MATYRVAPLRGASSDPDQWPTAEGDTPAEAVQAYIDTLDQKTVAGTYIAIPAADLTIVDVFRDVRLLAQPRRS